jgi:hypothetical protein
MRSTAVLALVALAAVVPGAAHRPPSGSLVLTFGTTATPGSVTSNPTPWMDIPTATALSGGALYLAGQDFTNLSMGANARWRIEKRDAGSGGLVGAFGTGGVVNVNPSEFADVPYALVVDEAGGALFVAGYQTVNGGSDTQWRVEKRSLTTGALLTSFGTGGVLLLNPSALVDEARALAFDGTGLFVAGIDHSPGTTDTQWRVVKLNPATGMPDPAFATVFSNPSEREDTPNTVVAQGGYLLIGGDDQVPANRRARIEKRNAVTGALVAAFGGGTGVVTFDTPQDDRIQGLVTDGTGLYSLATSNFVNLRALKHDFGDGQPVAAFGSAGVVLLGYGRPSGSIAPSIPFALSGSTLYMGGSIGGLAVQIHLEARKTSNGDLVNGFGAGGVVTSNPTSGDDGAVNLVTDASSLYVTAVLNGFATDRAWYIEKRVK